MEAYYVQIFFKMNEADERWDPWKENVQSNVIEMNEEKGMTFHFFERKLF